MKVKVVKITRIVLLVIACITFIVGIVLSQKATKEAATDLSNISISVVEKNEYFNPNESPYINGCYHISFTFSITNNTKVDWGYLEILTTVYDKNGNELGTISSSFGSSYGSSNLNLEVGDTVTKTTEIKDNQPDGFFKKLYESQLSDLTYESVVTHGSYYN